MAADQLSYFPEFKGLDKKEVQLSVIRELRKYRALKVKIENRKEQQEQGVFLFSSLRKANGFEDVRKEEQLLVKQVDRALNVSIDETERSIIELKYLSPFVMNDLDIYTELGLKKGKYYEKKSSAIFGVALALGII